MKNILSERQLEIMELLWNSPEPLTAKEIQDRCDLCRNTIDACLRSLLKNNHIEACSVVYSGTVLARSYKPILTREKFLHTACNSLQSIYDNGYMISSLVKQINTIVELDKLLKMIEEKRRELNGD